MPLGLVSGPEQRGEERGKSVFDVLHSRTARPTCFKKSSRSTSCGSRAKLVKISLLEVKQYPINLWVGTSMPPNFAANLSVPTQVAAALQRYRSKSLRNAIASGALSMPAVTSFFAISFSASPDRVEMAFLRVDFSAGGSEAASTLASIRSRIVSA